MPCVRHGPMTSLPLMLVVLACSTSPSTNAAESALRSRLDNGSDQRLQLTDFRRSDGRAGEIGGVKTYTIMFEANAQFVTDAMYSVGAPITNKGDRIVTSEYRASSRRFSWSDFASASQGNRRARKGDRLHLQGQIGFEKRESGWVATAAQMSFQHDSTSRVDSDQEDRRPQAEAISQAGQPGEARQLCSEDACLSYITAMKSDLRNLVSTQESFFSDSSTYTSSLQRLGFRSSSGVTSPQISVGGGWWFATNSHRRLPNVVCGVAVNYTNPVDPAGGEGEPVCRRGRP